MLRWLACLTVIGLASAAFAGDGEESIPLDKLPKAVVNAVKKRFPKGEMVEAAKETADKKTVYEVTVKVGKQTIDVMLTPEGVIELIEKEISAKDLPQAVTDALAAKYPKATFKIVEEIVKVKEGKEEIDAYEVLLVTADKKTWEVKLDKAGKIVETEEKTKDKEDK